MEWEIQKALLEHGQSDLAADALLKKFAPQKLKLPRFQALATFLLHAGFYATLFDFILHKLNDGSDIPWAHFTEAIFLSVDTVPDEIQRALLDGAAEKNGLGELSQTRMLDDFDPEILTYRAHRKSAFWERYQEKKGEYLRELELFQSQGLEEQAESLINQLLKAFPMDSEILAADTDMRRRQAAKIVAEELRPRNKKQQPLYHYEILDDETEALMKTIELQMQQLIAVDSGWAQDFALAHLFWDNFEGALRLLEAAPQDWQVIWLRAEIMIRGRYFGELLEYLNQLEPQIEAEPESTFAIYYLRAQALWGLNERTLALTIMKSLVDVRPQYRSAHTLLDGWKEEPT